MKLDLEQQILTENDCYKIGRTIQPQGVMVHSTGADNPNLRRYVQPVSSTPGREELLSALGTNPNGNHWNRPGLDVCVHGFIGRLADGSVAAVQTLPWAHRGWHAGTGTSGRSANDTHISFEMCEDDLTDPAYFRQAYRTAVELTAMLCREYGLDPLADGVVICHQEGYRRGLELKLVEELSNREIARCLRIRESTVSSRVMRGRAMLQKRLREEGFLHA